MTEENNEIEETGEKPEVTTTPAPALPPSDDKDKEINAYKTAMLDERSKRKTAEKALEEAMKAPPPDIDPFDPESITQAARDAAKKEFETLQSANAQAEADRQWQQQIESAKEKYSDLDIPSILGDQTLPISDQMADIIQRSQNGMDMVVALHNNRDVAKSISMLDPTNAAIEMGRLLSGQSEQVQISNAPGPIETVGQGSSVDKDPDDMTPAEYEAYVREKRGGTVFAS